MTYKDTTTGSPGGKVSENLANNGSPDDIDLGIYGSFPLNTQLLLLLGEQAIRVTLKGTNRRGDEHALIGLTDFPDERGYDSKIVVDLVSIDALIVLNTEDE